MSSVTAPLEKIPVPKVTIPDSEYAANCIALGMHRPNSVLAHLATTPAILEASHVDLSPNFLGGIGLQAMTSVLFKNQNLTSLNVSGNGLSNESIVFFCRAFIQHRALKSLNVSNNPLTLPAGEALLDFCQRNACIEEIDVTNTRIDDGVIKQIKKILSQRRNGVDGARDNKGTTKKIAPTAINATSTPYQRVLEEYLPKRDVKKTAALEAKAKAETAALEALVGLSGSCRCPPVDPTTMWTVVDVAIVGFPTIFNSELKVILDEIMPTLNRRYADQRLFFNVLDTPSTEDAGKTIDVTTLVVAEDFLADVRKSSAVVIELVGDRVGFIEHVPAYRPGEAAKAPPMHPVQYSLHDAASAQSGTLLISCIRKSTRSLQVSPALVPIFSEEPSLVHPDVQASVVKAAVAKARGVEHKLGHFDIDVAQRAWAMHKCFQDRVRDKTPDALLINQYHAAYDAADGTGRVFLKDLDEFKSKLQSRLDIIARSLGERVSKACISSGISSNNVLQLKASALLQNASDNSSIRKQLLGKMDLYTVTPPSRNMLLLHGVPGLSLTTTMAAYVHRCQKKNQYIVASHFVRHPALSDEPSDLRSLFMNLVRQMTPDHSVPKTMQFEIDVVKLQSIFYETLAQTSQGLEDGKVLVLAIDGLSDIDDAVLPCSALRTSETGADIWTPSMNLVEGSAPSDSVNSETTKHLFQDPSDPAFKMSFIPSCLPRNVRVVGTAISRSSIHTALESRGRDSTETVQLSELTANEIDMVVQSELLKQGYTPSDDDLTVLRGKLSSTSPEYLSFAVDAFCSLREAPGYLSPSATFETLPPTVSLCCDSLLGQVEAEFGVNFAKNALGLLIFSRWGLSEMDLREMLGEQMDSKKSSRFPTSKLNKFLRLLRPVLLNIPQNTDESRNTLLQVVFIRSREMRKTILSRYFANEEQSLLIHQQLAHHYRKLIEANRNVAHPLARTAFKELPFHAVSAKLWSLLVDTVFSLEYVSQCYQLGLGYHLFREGIRAYNHLHSDSTSNNTMARNAAVLDKVKQYLLFIRCHNINLVQFPHLVAQIAVGSSSTPQVQQDALSFFKQNSSLPHFLVANRGSGKLHRDRVTDAQYAPNGIRFATCSDDRSIRIVNLFGESILQICQSASKLKLIRYSTTSRYLLTATEDRSTFIFDATSGQLVSKGSSHAAAIRCAELSIRGKFYATGSDDRTMKVWESETGALLATASHSHITVASSSSGGIIEVHAHPMDESTFFTACDKKILGWKLTHLRDACEEVLCIQAHNSLPLSTMSLAMDGSYVVACARDTDITGSVVRTEESIKIWTTSNGRLVAILARGSAACGPTFAAVSPDESRLASAHADGTISLYALDWRSFSVDGTGQPTIVQPYKYLKGFQGHATPTALFMKFSHDSALLFAVGNVRQLKLWSTQSVNGQAKPVETLAEYLSDQPVTALAVSPNPQEEGGTIALGDATGRVLTLRIAALPSS